MGFTVLDCFFCGCEVTKKDNIKIKRSVTAVGIKDNNNAEILKSWEEECVLSTCRSLKIPRSHPAVGELLSSTSTKFCGGCVTLMRDLDFSLRAMDRLQRNITKLHRTLLDKLEWKSQTSPDKKTGRKSTDRTGNDETFDLFEFVLTKTKEVTNEDKVAEYIPDIVHHKSTQKATDLVLTEGPQRVVEVKEEYDCDDNAAADDFDDVILPHFEETEEEQPRSFEELNEAELPKKSEEFEVANLPEAPSLSGDVSSDEDYQLLVTSSEEESTSDYSESDDNEEEEDDTPRKISRRNNTNQNRKRSGREVNTPRRKKKPPCNIPCLYDGCEVMVKTPNALDTHIKRNHRDNQVKFFPCDLCDKKFVYNANMKIHRKDVHQNSTRKPSKPKTDSNSADSYESPCSFCGLFQKSDELEEHENLHRSREFPFSCLICDTKLTKAPALRTHMKRAHPSNVENMKQCHQCGVWLTTESALRNHLFRLHQESTGPCLTCDFCSKICTTPQSKEDHMKKCIKAPHNKFKSVCDKCGKVLQNKYQLATHVLTHEEPQFKCALCNRAFHRKTTLVKHQELHAGVQFPCPDCDMVFNTAQYLKRHSKRHAPRVLRRYRIDKEKRGLCPQGDSCTRNCKMIHLGFPFKCDLCPKTFRTEFQLKYHGKSHLPDELKRHRRKTDKTDGFTDMHNLNSRSSESEDEEMNVCPETLELSLIQ